MKERENCGKLALLFAVSIFRSDENDIQKTLTDPKYTRMSTKVMGEFMIVQEISEGTERGRMEIRPGLAWLFSLGYSIWQ